MKEEIYQLKRCTIALLLILLGCLLVDIICNLFFYIIARAGNMNMGIYEPDCEFADPFVSFKGLKRFKQNVSNLGSFMEESSLKITDWQEYEVQNLLQVSSMSLKYSTSDVLLNSRDYFTI